MNDWVILASLILVAAVIIVCTFTYIKEGDSKDQGQGDDDHDDILGI